LGQILACEICGVTPVTEEQKTALFHSRLTALSLAVPQGAPQQLARYQTLLEDWNTRMNLTGDASLEATIDRHFLDSVAPLAYTALWPEGTSVIDVGTGAGFPGLPLAILRPDFQVTLLDSLQKRLTFLQAVTEALQLTNITFVHARAEDAGRDPAFRERYDVATARAVAAVPALMELLLPFVRVGGNAICYKGPAAEDELRDGERASRLLGGGAVKVLPVSLPDHPDWRHCLLISQKRMSTPKAFPRKAGLPAKVPLGRAPNA